jgi:hypothetical protein
MKPQRLFVLADLIFMFSGVVMLGRKSGSGAAFLAIGAAFIAIRAAQARRWTATKGNWP